MSLICEFSSIFVAWRSALSRLGFKQSKVYWFVGVTMIVIFFLVYNIIASLSLNCSINFPPCVGISFLLILAPEYAEASEDGDYY